MVAGALPAAKPDGYLTWKTLGAEAGAEASGMIEPLPASFQIVVHPLRFSASKPQSEMVVKPEGSLAQDPEGGGGGGCVADTVRLADALSEPSVAVMVVVPAASAVTIPLRFPIVPTRRLLLVKVTV